MLLTYAIDVQKRMIDAMTAQYDAEQDPAKKLRIHERISCLHLSTSCMAIVEGTENENKIKPEGNARVADTCAAKQAPLRMDSARG